MFDTTFFPILVYTSLTLFIFLMLISIVAVFVAINVVSKIQEKTEETLDIIQNSATNIGEVSINLGSLVSQLTFWKPKKNVVSWIADILTKM